MAKSSLPTTSAEEKIDSYTQGAIAKINDNANAMFSHIADANERALKKTLALEKLATDNTQRLENASTASAKMKAEVRKLEERIDGLSATADHLIGALSIARAGIGAINEVIGKVVVLKSSEDLKMTAARMADDGGVFCVWMRDGWAQSASIPLVALHVSE